MATRYRNVPKLAIRVGIAGWLVLSLLFPLVAANPYYLQVIILSNIWAIAVYGLNIIVGFAGQLSLAHAGFLGIGAYTVALLTVHKGTSYWLALALGCTLSVTIGYLISLISFRTRGHYFAILTLALGVIVNLVIERWDILTNGNIGVANIPTPSSLGIISFDGQIPQYYMIFAFLLVAMYVSAAVHHSLVGRTMVAVRNSEDLAEAVGISVTRMKRLAFLLSSCFAGLAGGLYAGYVGYLGPEISSPAIMFDMLLYLLVGGMATLAGPLVGTLVVTAINQFLTTFQDYQMLVFGPILVLLIIFVPSGLVGLFGRCTNRLRTKTLPSKDGQVGNWIH